ncbi:MAG: discoidin domain-containing protein [Bifidobacteriaceae bacterium]|nr:discoidin domain-containing protein [Bifidobacteriaceae bacterium]
MPRRRSGTGGSAAYFFNSVYPLTTLVQLAKYDPSWAKAAGRWALNLTNSARYFLPDQRAAANQSNPEFLGGPEAAVLAYERLNTNDLKATGDAMVSPGWGTGPDVTDLAIYGMIYTGALGGLVQTTNVENLLRFDANKTDYFTAEAADGEAAKYPTWLYYNPHTTVQAVQIDLGASPRDLFDSTKGVYLAQNATGVQTFRMLGDSASVIAVLPAGSPAPVMDGQTVTIGGVLVSHSTADVLPLPGDDAVEQVAISGSAAITARGATATYSAEVTPSSAISLDVTWSVAGVDGRATAKAVIGPDDGVLTPVLNGQVVVRATARDGSGVFDEQVVTISGQTLPYLSLNKPVTVSHTINQAKERINDGDVSTRWNGRTGTSGDAHPWVYIDLVNPAQISLITVEWESAYARDFRVQWSNDASTWQDIEVFANQSLSNHAVSAVSQASLDALAQAAPDGVRYVRMYVDAINNASWGVSVYEFSIDGSYNITQPVTALTVAGAGGAEEITRPGRALQMVATALPLDATDTRVEWYVYDLSGNETAAADVDSTGRLIPLADGLVQVVARSVDGGDVSGACEISITGQSKPNLALGRPIGANRSEMPVSYANDGSYATRWSSGSMAADDRAAVEVDLGAARLVDSVAVAWEAAAAPSYLVQVRLDAAAEWTTVGSGAGVGDAIQDIDFAPVLARHVRLAEMTRSSYGGVSIWELEVYGPLLYLRFDLNGLSAWFEDLQTPADLAAEHGSVIGDLPELELFGQVFLGWNTAADGSGAWYQTGDVFTASQAVTLYAQYEPDLGAPEPLALRSQTGVKCIAGKAYLTVTAFNDSDQAAAITVTTPFGVKVFPSIAGGKSGFHSFTTRMAAYSGVPVAVSGQAVDDPTLTGSTEPTVAAASCG